MDFILSLIHFCEQHGPTSILSTQVVPFSCPLCYPEPSPSTPPATTSRVYDDIFARNGRHGERREKMKSQMEADNPAPTIEAHPDFIHLDSNADAERLQRRWSAIAEDTCASCSLTLPESVSKRLPSGAPGSPLPPDGRAISPVLRSRELVHSCGNNPPDLDDDLHDPHCHHYETSESIQSHSSDSSCHNHVITYLTLRGPQNPADYALLRRSSIRTLSCELLPRGLTSGPLSFGDAVTGYTIAYIFRLSDNRARGKKRAYALIAMAGKDAGRAFRACPVIWRTFEIIALGITAAADRFQEEERLREEGVLPRRERDDDFNKAKGRNWTPVSSFLNARTVDPDGYPRRAGPIKAKSLAEIVGNESVFAEIHAQFVALLHQLGTLLGGVPVTEVPMDGSISSSDGDSAVQEQVPRTVPVT